MRLSGRSTDGEKKSTAVDYKYLEALYSRSGEMSTSSTPLPSESSGLSLLVLGVTFGFAIDDIDIALCRFTQDSPDVPLCLEILQFDSVITSSKMNPEILSMIREDAASPSILSLMDAEMGLAIANAIHAFCQKNSINLDDVDLIGSGGHLMALTGTPPKGQRCSNICLGEGAIIAAKTGVTTVSDFRTTEQAVGRHGAPLFTYLNGLLLHHSTRMQICLTIDGITTVSFIPPDSKGGIDNMYDWDSGPGTYMIDFAYRYYGLDATSDQSTLLQGNICHPVVEQLLSNDVYLSAKPPKSTAREIYGDAMAKNIIAMCASQGCTPADTIATLARFTSASIVQQMLLFGPGSDAINSADIVLDCRGMPDPRMSSDLQAEFPGARFSTFDKTGVSSDAKKAVGFAMQAMEALLGRALPVCVNANVRMPNTITGKLAPGLNWRQVMAKSVAFGGSARGWEGLPEVRSLIVRKPES